VTVSSTAAIGGCCGNGGGATLSLSTPFTSGQGSLVNITAGSSANGYAGGSVTLQGGTGTTYGNILLAPSGGNVGIGTASPTEALSVNGNISLLAANSKLTGATGVTLEETGDTFGTVRLSLQNRSGVNGAMFEQAGSVDLVDFVFKGLSNQQNIRYENRGSAVVYGAPEFQIGPASTPYFIISGSAIGVTNNRPLMVGPFIANVQSAVTSSAAGIVGQVVRANSGQTADIFQTQTSAGSVLFNVAANGNVGISTPTPRASLDVAGTILGKPSVSNAGATIDFSLGNTQYTTNSCGAFQFNNLKDGGNYTFIVKGATAATCTFTGFSDAGSTPVTVHMPPDNGNTTANKHTIYNLIVGGSDVYVAWTPGY
jgi:hypothetical protein